MRLENDKIMEDGKVFFQSPILESIVVAGRIEQKVEGGYVSWLPLLLYGTENCCQGSVGTLHLGNGVQPMRLNTLNSLDTNVFDIQPVVMMGGRSIPNLGIIAAGYGCSGNGARLIDTHEVKVYDILPTNRCGHGFRLREGFNIHPDILEKRFWLENSVTCREGYEKAGAKVDGSMVTYNSMDLPKNLTDVSNWLSKYGCHDITSALAEHGVDIDASIELAKTFTKTRRLYHLEGTSK